MAECGRKPSKDDGGCTTFPPSAWVSVIHITDTSDCCGPLAAIVCSHRAPLRQHSTRGGGAPTSRICNKKHPLRVPQGLQFHYTAEQHGLTDRKIVSRAAAYSAPENMVEQRNGLRGDPSCGSSRLLLLSLLRRSAQHSRIVYRPVPVR